MRSLNTQYRTGTRVHKSTGILPGIKIVCSHSCSCALVFCIFCVVCSCALVLSLESWGSRQYLVLQIVHLRRSKYQQRRCHKERREVLCATNDSTLVYEYHVIHLSTTNREWPSWASGLSKTPKSLIIRTLTRKSLLTLLYSCTVYTVTLIYLSRVSNSPHLYILYDILYSYTSCGS